MSAILIKRFCEQGPRQHDTREHPELGGAADTVIPLQYIRQQDAGLSLGPGVTAAPAPLWGPASSLLTLPC